MPPRFLWSCALVLVTAIWGWSFVAKHHLLASLPASALNAWMFSLAAAALLPFAVGSLRGFTRRDWLGAVLAGTVLFAAFALQTSGVAQTTPSNAGFITGLCTVFTPLILFLLGRGRPSCRQASGLALALVGLGLLSLDGFALHQGDLLMLGCAVAFALHIVIVATFSSAAAAMASAFVQLLLVGLLSLCWSIANHEFAWPPSLPIAANLLVLALLATALAYAIQIRAQAVLAPERVALILICEPVFSGVFGYLLAGDRLPPEKLAGALLILVGIAVSEIHWGKRAPPTPFQAAP
jgi:drug/metabolite transporter (DMT)-like permease